MASRDKYAEKYLRFHKTYEKRAINEIMRTFGKWIKDIQWGTLQAGSYKSIVNTTLNIDDLISSYIRIYTEIGKVHGKRVIKDIDLEIKSSHASRFATLFEMNVSQFLRTFGLKRITTVRKTFFEFIIDLFETRIEEDIPMQTIVSEIQKKLDKPKTYRWMAQRIARTESTAASNYAAIQAAEVSGFVMVKHWIATIDARTRRPPESIFNHLAMDGKKVKLNEKFIFSGGLDALSFPGDPTGEPGNIINCRCAVAVAPLRDKNGKLVRTE